MQVIKPFALGFLTRCIEHRRRIGLSITASVYFPFAPKDQGTAWSEMSMWNFLGKEMPEGPLIDEGVMKLRAEFLVHGQAHAPGGSARHCAVRARVGARDKTLHVFGTRYWLDGRASEPLTFDSVPLNWARAYGGPDFAANPQGMGRVVDEINGVRVRLLPQVEQSRALLSDPDATAEPASFDRIELTRPQRAQYQGTYDASWLKEQSPGFADDTDWRLFNLAPPDQWFDAPLRGDEPFSFSHMHPTKPEVGGHLPGLRARCFINHGSAAAPPRISEVPLRLTTVWFFPHAERGILLFQGLAACAEDDASDLPLLMGALERLDEAKSDEHYARVMAQRLDPRAGAMHALRERDLLPSDLKGSDPDFEAIQADYRPEGLMAEAQRRGAVLKVQIARDEARARGVDPDKLNITILAPQKAPTLEELPEFIEHKQIEALNAQVSALLDAAEQMQRAREQAERFGIDPEALAHRGPPTYRAAQHLAQLLAAVPADSRGPDGQPLIDPAALAPKLRQVEAMERSGYLATAHTQPAAPPMLAEGARLVRDAVMQAHARGQSFMAADLTGADLSGLDLRGADFTGAWLESANLKGSLLTGCSFAAAVLAHADLSAVDASEADFSGANLGKATLTAARFVRSDLSGANFSDTSLAQTDLRQATLDGATLIGARFGLADWRGVKASGLVFHRVALQDMVLHQAQLVQPQFIECDLSSADFSGATLERATFVQCRGQGVRFTKATLPGAVFVQHCQMDGADFSGAHLKGSNLRGSGLVQASFRDANLDDCDLSEATLAGADLVRATLRRTLLVKTGLRAARLVDANLMEAVLQRADLRGADLRGANLFGADLSRVRTDPGTAFAGALVQRARLYPRREPETTGAP